MRRIFYPLLLSTLLGCLIADCGGSGNDSRTVESRQPGSTASLTTGGRNPTEESKPSSTAETTATIGDPVVANGYRVTVSNPMLLTEFAPGYQQLPSEQGLAGVAVVDLEACRIDESAGKIDFFSFEDTRYRTAHADSYVLEYVGLREETAGFPLGAKPDVGDCARGKIGLPMAGEARLKTVIWDPRTLPQPNLTVVRWASPRP